MTRKIFRSILLVSLVMLLAALAAMLLVSSAALTGRLTAELQKEAAYVAAGTELGGEAYLASLADPDVRITLVAPDGKVLYDTAADAAAMENHAGREEIREALEAEDGCGSAVRDSATGGGRTAYEARRLADGTVVRVSCSLPTRRALLLPLLQPLLLLLLGAAAVAALAARHLSGRIVRPLRALDPDRPQQTAAYEELQPLLDKLASQRRKIAGQLEELTARQAEFATITEKMREGMLVISPRAEILSCNPSARRILRLGEAVPKSVLQLEQGDGFREAVRLALSGKPGETELRAEDRYYALLATPVQRDGVPAGAVLVLLDETEKEEREILRREFTSNVSHELKTPLTSISGFAELIRNGMTDEADTRRFADTIYREAARMISLVGDIIKLSQLDGGEIPYDHEKIDLRAVAAEVTERLRPLAERRGMTLSLEGTAATITGNRQILDEMLGNLCDNGIKYGREGGFVRITTGVREDNGSGGHAFATVEDNGIGIPKEQQDRVFERFYRVDKSHSREIGGTGLGLSIVKHGAQFHHAQIALESTPGKGTRVTLTF